MTLVMDRGSTLTVEKTTRRKLHRELPDRLLAIIALVTIAAAYFYGLTRARADILPSLRQALPSAERYEPVSSSVYAGYQGAELVGYVGLGEATGYGGPLQVAVAVDLQGAVTNLVVVDHKETPSFFNRVAGSELLEALVGKSFDDAYRIGEDVDGVSGATYTTRAIADAARRGSRSVAVGPLGKSIPVEEAPPVHIGIPEVVLVLLFATGFIAHRRQFKFTKQARWISMVTGLLVLGFWLNRPLTIANINQLLMGFWPAWQNNLYWYLLIGGILFVFTADNKNPYCEWFCPFGAAQECLAVVGGAKVRSPGQFKEYLKWLQRGLAWLAIVLALTFRNPGISSYEVFGSLFDLMGSSFQFALLGIVLLASLFIKRPWCTYLCPLHPVEELIRMIRRWLVELWKKNVRRSA